MPETMQWWLVSTVIGLIAAPYAFRLFRFLPDRGASAARALGILLTVYSMWMLSVLGIAPFTAGTAVLVLAVFAVGAVLLAGQDRAAIVAHLRRRRDLLIAGELVFIVALAGFALLRAHAPAIEFTEKPFEFAFFNGVLRSPDMPPADPWYGGEPMSYYYGGYLIMSLCTQLTGVAPSVAFNLGVAFTAGLTALAAFGLGSNLVLLLRGRPRGLDRALPWALAGGLLGVLLLLVIGNLEGAVEVAAAHGVGEPSWYQRLGIENLTGLKTTERWYPDEFLFWWRATRLGSGWNVIEFPFFSFMLGDLHAHVMVLPLSLLGLALVLNLLCGGVRLDVGTVRRRPLLVLLLGLLAGMLALANSWDQPVFLLLLLTAAVLLNAGRGGLTWRGTAQAIIFIVPVALLSFVLYLPFFADLHPATSGIAPVEITSLPAGVPAEAMVLPPHHFLLIWGPLLLIGGGGLIIAAVRRRLWRAAGDDWITAVTLGLLPLLLWAAALTGKHGTPAAVFDEIGARAGRWAAASYWLVHLSVLALVIVGLALLLTEARRPHTARRAGGLYLALAATAALALLHVIELFYVKEPTPARTNTLFKFSYTAWLLLATSGGAALITALPWRPRPRDRRAAAITTLDTSAPAMADGGTASLGPNPPEGGGDGESTRARPQTGVRRRPAWPLVPWLAAVAVLLLLALLYPVTAAMNQTYGFSATPTLDGLATLRAQDPDEYEAAIWLAENLPGRPLILEAVDGDYSAAGRVSSRTGFPTVLGWPFHEAQERGGRDYPAQAARVAARQQDVETIYRTTNIDEARALLTRYGVDYVYLGRLELDRYGAAGVEKFEQLGRITFRNRTVTVYGVSTDAPPLGHRR